MSDQWSFAEFRRDISVSDPDFHIHALEKLGAYLSRIDVLKLPQHDLEYLFMMVRGRAEDQEGQQVTAFAKVSAALRVIVLLADKLPAESADIWLGQIAAKPFQDGCPIRSHYESIFKEILVNSMSYPPEKQQVVKKRLFREYRDTIRQKERDKTKSAMELMANLTTSLGFLFAEEDLREVHHIVSDFISSEWIDISTEIAELAVACSVYLQQETFEEFVRECLGHMNNPDEAGTPVVRIAFVVVSRCVLHHAKLFPSFLDDVISVFYGRVVALGTESEQDDDDDQRIEEGETSLLCLDALITAFPESFVETANYYSDLVFDYIGYGTTVAASITDSQVGVTKEDIGFGDMDIEESDEEAIIGDDSWKVRKAANRLAQTLIRKYPDTFFDSLMTHLPAVLLLISDTDSGAKAIALQTLLLLAKTYRTKLSKETVTEWTSKLVNELLDDDTALVALVLPTLTTMVKEFSLVPDKYLRRAVNTISKNITAALVPEMLSFLSAVISECQGITDHALTVAQILSQILDMNNSVAQCVATIGQLYYYMRKPTPEILKAFTDLNKKVIGLAATPSDKQLAALGALSAFVCVHSTAETVSESIAAIVKCLKQDSCAKLASSCIALMGASPAASMLSKVASDALGVLATHVASSDALLAVRALWALFIGLSKGVFKPEQCESVINPLVAVLESSDTRCKLLALKIAKLLASLPACSSVMVPEVKKLLAEQRLGHKAVSAAAEFVCAAKCDVNALCDFLLQKSAALTSAATVTLDNTLIAGNIALFVALVTATNAESNKKMINDLETAILKDAKVDPMKLRIIGEIGARTDLAAHTELVKKIFSLVKSDDRVLFAAAAESAGLVASGSIGKIAVEFLDNVISDPGRLGVWLLGINVFLKCVKKQKAQIQLDNLAKFLIQNADFEKETSSSVAECLGRVIDIQPGLIEMFLENVVLREKSSPLTARAVASFLEKCDESAAEPIITRVLPYLDPENPSTTASVILCYKACLRFTSLHMTLATAFDSVLKCLKVTPAQFRDLFYGAERRTVDLGRLMRINAIDTISAVFNTMPERMDFDYVVSVCAESINDPRPEVQKRVITFLCRLCERPSINKSLRSEHNLPALGEALENLDEVIFNDDANELVEPYLMLITRLRMSLSAVEQTNSTIERLYTRRKNSENMAKIESDAEFVMEFHRVSVSTYQARSVGYLLMAEYNPEAVDIFAN